MQYESVKARVEHAEIAVDDVKRLGLEQPFYESKLSHASEELESVLKVFYYEERTLRDMLLAIRESKVFVVDNIDVLAAYYCCVWFRRSFRFSFEKASADVASYFQLKFKCEPPPVSPGLYHLVVSKPDGTFEVQVAPDSPPTSSSRKDTVDDPWSSCWA